MKNDVIAFYKNFECVFFSNVKSTAQLDGKNYAAEFINFSDYTCGFHIYGSLHFGIIYIPQNTPLIIPKLLILSTRNFSIHKNSTK